MYNTSQSIRFEFGKNWLEYSKNITNESISIAVEHLRSNLNIQSLYGKSFVDVGCGSGLFSLAARKLGAFVLSFDFDEDSVACTKKLKFSYFKNDPHWIIKQGSILDSAYISNLGTFDIVYSWGVLHHTGNMFRSFDLTSQLVKKNGILYISIYNDQGVVSIFWKHLKFIFNKLPKIVRSLVTYILLGIVWSKKFIIDVITRKPLMLCGKYSQIRGMSRWFDMIDWLGGYPFEVAKPSDIIRLFQNKGFNLIKCKNCGRKSGCNEFIFIREH